MRDPCTSSPLYAFRNLTGDIHTLKIRSMKEALCHRDQRLNASGSDHIRTEVLLTCRLPGEPQPAADRRTQVLVVLTEEGRGPVGVRAAEERVARPAGEVERDRVWNGHVGEHSSEDAHDLILHLGVRKRFDAQRVVAL